MFSFTNLIRNNFTTEGHGMNIVQHIPNFCEGDEPPICVEFQTVEELLAIEFVANWSLLPKFYQYSLFIHKKKGGHKRHAFMAEFDEGKEWWVVGKITAQQPDKLGLPVFEQKLSNGVTVVSYVKQMEVVEQAREYLKSRGIYYPVYDVTATPEENYGRILAYAEQEANQVVKILRELSPGKMTPIEPPMQKKQWNNYND